MAYIVAKENKPPSKICKPKDNPFLVTQREIRLMTTTQYIQLLDKRIERCDNQTEDLRDEIGVRERHLMTAKARLAQAKKEGGKPRSLGLVCIRDRIKHQSDAIRGLRRHLRWCKGRVAQIRMEKRKLSEELEEEDEDEDSIIEMQ